MKQTVSSQNRSTEYMLFKDGEWECTIVLPAQPSEIERQAIDDLRHYLGKMTGVAVELAGPGQKSDTFQIVPGLVNREYDIPIPQLEKEGFFLSILKTDCISLAPMRADSSSLSIPFLKITVASDGSGRESWERLFLR
jgi:hypothetical protein